MAAPIRNTMPPIHVSTLPGGLVNPPSSQRGIRIATVPGTKIVNRSVFRIGQNLRDTVVVASKREDSRHNVTVKYILAEEHKDAASDSSRVDPDNSIHIFPRG